MPNNNPLKTILLRISYIILICLALFLLALAIVRFAPPVFSYISQGVTRSFQSVWGTFKPAPSLGVTSSKQIIQSGETFVLSWDDTPDHTNNTIAFACTKDVTVMYQGSGNGKIPVPCGEEFRLGPNATSSIFSAVLDRTDSFADIDFMIDQEQADGKNRKGEITITITTGKEPTLTVSTSTPPAVVTPPATTTPTKPAVTTSKPVSKPSTTYYPPVNYGPADLVVGPITTGIVNPYTGVFVPTNTIRTNDIAAVQFTVTNAGGSNTGSWVLSSTLPNQYNSQNQAFESQVASLGPLSSVILTLRLGSVTDGSYSIVIVADTRNNVIESNESNNNREVHLVVGDGRNTSSKADLSVRLVSVTSPRSDEARIQFEVKNIGGKVARDWKFHANLPTNNNNDDEYESREQSDLDPGEAVILSLTFDDLDNNGYAEIEVDSDDDVDESNERNNDLRVRVTN